MDDITTTEGSSAIATDPTPAQAIMEDTRFTGSVSYSPDEAPKTVDAPDQPISDRPRNERGQFTEKPKEQAGEVKPVKLPESIKPPKPRDEKDINGRFHDLSRSHEEMRRELRIAREELQALRSGVSKPEQAPAEQPTPKPASKLKPEDYQSYDEYMQATVAETLKDAKAQEEAQRKEQDTQRYYQEKRSEFERHARALVEEVPNFWEVISDKNFPMTNPMANAVIELGEMGPVTALYLAGKPEEALSIAKMAPLQATIAIGKIAARLEHEFKQANSSPAPAQPVQPRPKAVPDVRGGSPGESLDDQPNEKDSVDEWVRKETVRMRKIDPRAKFWTKF